MEEPQLARAPVKVFAAVERVAGRGRRRGLAAPGGAGRGTRGDRASRQAGRCASGRWSFQREGGTGCSASWPSRWRGPTADLCAVILNPGALRRIGSGRMWVEIARRWAARGVPTLRLDLAGIGDSDGDAERYADTGALYVQELVPQVIEAMDELEAPGPAQPLPADGPVLGRLLVLPRRAARPAGGGLCTCSTSVRCSGTGRWRPCATRARLAGRSTGSRWRRLLTGKVPLGELFTIVRATLLSPWTFTCARAGRAGAAAGRSRPPSTSLRDGRQRLVAGLRRRRARDATNSSGMVTSESGAVAEHRVANAAGNSHTFRPLRAQRRVYELLDDELETELEASARPRPTGTALAS